MTDSVAAARLKSFVERIERLEDEVRGINTDKSEVYKEVEADGYSKAALREVIKLRRMDDAARRERDELIDLYMHALGMATGDDETTHETPQADLWPEEPAASEEPPADEAADVDKAGPEPGAVSTGLDATVVEAAPVDEPGPPPEFLRRCGASDKGSER